MRQSLSGFGSSRSDNPMCWPNKELRKQYRVNDPDEITWTTKSDRKMSFEHLLPPSWKQQVGNWLAEDTPSFDYGGYVVGDALREAFLFGKGSQPAVLAGSPFVDEIFAQLDCKCVFIVAATFKSSFTIDYQSRMACKRRRHIWTCETYRDRQRQSSILAVGRTGSTKSPCSM